MGKNERMAWLLVAMTLLVGAEVWESREFTATKPEPPPQKSACEELGGTSDGQRCTVSQEAFEILEGKFEGPGGPDQ